jgi:hypothetical protein
MDFSILYRVLWKPSDVFKGFLAKPRPEPFILISVIIVIATIKTYINNIQRLLDQPSLFFIGLIQGYFLLLFLPTLYALFTLIAIRFSQQTKTRFTILVSAFILCNIPQYIPSFLKMAFRLPTIYFTRDPSCSSDGGMIAWMC